MAKRRQLDFEGVAEPVRIGQAARSILQKTVDNGVVDLEMAKIIRLDLIEPDPDQPRKHFDEEAIRDLAQSIRMQGVLQPIIVEWVPERERFRIISGERRWRATRLAGEWQETALDPSIERRDLTRIPAVIKNPSAIDRYVQQVYENEQRQDYSDVERAFAYERLKESLALTWDDLASKLGLSKGRIHQIRRTKNRLAPAVQLDITSGKLSGRHGLYLAPLPEAVQETVAAAVKEHHLTHQQTQVVAQRVRSLIETSSPSTDLPQNRLENIDDPEQLDISHFYLTPTEAPNVTADSANLTEHTGKIAAAQSEPAEGITCYTPSLTEAVQQVVTEVMAPRPPVARAKGPDLDKAMALMRQLMRLEITPPETAAERAKLSRTLSELATWIEVQQAGLVTEKV